MRKSGIWEGDELYPSGVLGRSGLVNMMCFNEGS
jgi:hypothetical protein